MAANNDPNCEWSWMDERHPSTDVTAEDNGPPDEGDDDDLEAGWPLLQAVSEALCVTLGHAYDEMMLLHGYKPRSL